MDLLETRRPRLLLIAFCLLTWLPGLFVLPPTDRDESRFAQASKQMIESGDYVRIMNGDEPRNRKPIGIHWLQVPFARVAQVAGVATVNPIWPYRLPSLLGALLGVLAVFEFGQALVGRRAALLAAGMLGACVVVVVEAHLAKTDAALLGATTVAMGLLARAYTDPAGFGARAAAGFWLAVAAGILLKGPLTPMVVVLAAAALCVADRRAGWLRALRTAWGLPLAVLAVSPWFVAIGVATHGAFFHDAVGGDLGRKLASGDDAHGAPPGLHLLLLPLLAFPSTLFVLRAIPAAWRSRRDAGTRFLLAWVVPNWAVFEAVPTKLPHYTLPLYPAVFLLAAQALERAGPAGAAWFRMAARGLAAAAAAILAVAALALPSATGNPLALGIPAAAAAGLTGWLAARGRTPVVVLAAMPVLTVALLGWELPQARSLWIAPRVVEAGGTAGEVVGAVGFHEPSLMFLAGTATALLPTGQAGAAALRDGRITRLLVDQRDEAAFRAEAARIGLDPRPLASVNGFNYSRGRVMRLNLYAPR